MKKFFRKSTITVVLISFLSLGFNSCMGSWSLTKKVYNFNDTISNNKYINNIIFWIIGVVYPITLMVDLVLLNTVEFWTGSNPMAMNENDRETKIVQNKYGKFKVTATKNKLEILRLDSKKQEKKTLQYLPEEKAWYLLGNGRNQKVAEFENFQGQERLILISQKGEKLLVN